MGVLPVGFMAFVAGLVDFCNSTPSELSVFRFDSFESFFGCGDHSAGELNVRFVISVGHPFELEDLAVGSDQFRIFGDFVESVVEVIFVVGGGCKIFTEGPLEELHGWSAVCDIGPEGLFGRAGELGALEKILEILLPELGFVEDLLSTDFAVCCESSEDGAGVGCGSFPADLFRVLGDDRHQGAEEGEFFSGFAVSAASKFCWGADDAIDAGFGFFDEVFDGLSADELFPYIVSGGRGLGVRCIIAISHGGIIGRIGSWGGERSGALKLSSGIGIEHP